MNTDDKIRSILRMEADTIEPSPAGWDAIQAGIAARRSRARWARGAALAGAAALVVGAVVYVGTDRSQRGITAPPATQLPTATEQPSPSQQPSPSPVFAGPNEPIGAIWPLTTTHEVAAWNVDHATYPSLATASGAAEGFVRNYLGIRDATVVAEEDSVGGHRFEVRRDTAVVSVLTVNGFGPGGTAPFVVTRAEGNDVRIDSPAAGGTVYGQFTASGSYDAADPAIDVIVRADTDATAPVELDRARATTGPPDGWSASLTATTTATTGSLLVTNASLRDGGIGSASAIPLVFGTPAVTPGPSQMVAARNGRIAVLSTATGEVVRWLTSEEPGGGAFQPELSEDGKTVVYAQGAGTCSSAVRSVPVAGGTPTTLVNAGEGSFGHPSRRGGILAYVRFDCDTAKQEIVVHAGTRIVEPVDGEVVGGPVVGDRFVAFISLKGNVRTLHTVDAHGELADNPVTSPEGCSWVTPTWGAKDSNDRMQLFVVASCSPRDEVVETWLYRFDADARNQVRLMRLDVLNVTSIDYAGDALLIGARDVRDPDMQIAYSYVGGKLRRIPGNAIRPTWE